MKKPFAYPETTGCWLLNLRVIVENPPPIDPTADQMISQLRKGLGRPNPVSCMGLAQTKLDA